MEIQWTATKGERALILDIAQRACTLDSEYSVLDLQMDIEACHCNGCPIRLTDLLLADDANFGHDVFGISAFISRDNGKLYSYFLPRFAKIEGDN